MASLGNLYAHFVSRTDIMVRKFNSPMHPDYGDTYFLMRRSSVLFDVVRLQHLWGEFCRVLILRSALGRFTTLNGQVLAGFQNVSNAADVTRFAISINNGRRMAWHVPNLAVKVASGLSIGNYT